MWRSLVAHLHGVQGVEGSNPFTPTNKIKDLEQKCPKSFFFIRDLFSPGCRSVAVSHRLRLDAIESNRTIPGSFFDVLRCEAHNLRLKKQFFGEQDVSAQMLA